MGGEPASDICSLSVNAIGIGPMGKGRAMLFALTACLANLALGGWVGPTVLQSYVLPFKA